MDQKISLLQQEAGTDPFTPVVVIKIYIEPMFDDATGLIEFCLGSRIFPKFVETHGLGHAIDGSR